MCQTTAAVPSRQAPRNVTLDVKRAAAQHHRTVLAQYRHALRDASSQDRQDIESVGVPADQVGRLLDLTGLNRVDLESITGLSQDSINDHFAGGRQFKGDAGLAILGLIDTINALEAVTENAGQNSQPISPERLAGAWLQTPHQALAGEHPMTLLRTAAGREHALNLLQPSKTASS